MWNSFYVGGPNRSQRMEAFKQILAESAVPVEIVILQEMLLGAQKKTHVERSQKVWNLWD